ncbi:chemotaxis protein CheW [Natranaerobius thermophilus]|uniref:CheW protein n=1 Tax=Natranaerobius thermophilus (strain ATCC BAA-1301 / DSM 18059 / JW/NM-WN-LF) TaxID=457570 RepID=B2A372_NATTJ|nr:chemotaxis protein CheW [Natranaerobius thermophilus]ACB85002.1 CheW protein [Natranaerobius thermophilus JW/NM-WN-LF]
MTETQATTGDQQYIVFNLGDEEYGVEILQVQTIERMLDITRVPHAPDFVEGVTNLRGMVVPIIDLRKRLNLPEKEATDETRIITVKIDEVMVGMIVDSASDVVKVPQDAIEPPPSIIGGVESTYIEGVAKLENRLLILLKLSEVLKKDEVDQLKNQLNT